MGKGFGVTDLYGSQDLTVALAVSAVSLSFFWALVRTLFRVIGNKGKTRA
jgi:hypothetical protein